GNPVVGNHHPALVVELADHLLVAAPDGGDDRRAVMACPLDGRQPARQPDVEPEKGHAGQAGEAPQRNGDQDPQLLATGTAIGDQAVVDAAAKRGRFVEHRSVLRRNIRTGAVHPGKLLSGVRLLNPTTEACVFHWIWARGRLSARSCGSGDSNTSRFFVTGCASASRVLWRNMRRSPHCRCAIRLKGKSPYFVSPTTGWPMASRWRRIWCVRPVSMVSSSKVASAPSASLFQ